MNATPASSQLNGRNSAATSSAIGATRQLGWLRISSAPVADAAKPAKVTATITPSASPPHASGSSRDQRSPAITTVAASSGASVPTSTRQIALAERRTRCPGAPSTRKRSASRCAAARPGSRIAIAATIPSSAGPSRAGHGRVARPSSAICAAPRRASPSIRRMSRGADWNTAVQKAGEIGDGLRAAIVWLNCSAAF